MIRKKEIYDRIIHELSIFVNDIEVKAENNLLDDNVLSEDFIKDLLNICLGWNLENLNNDTKRFPGIDLGDKERRIGVQVTSTKTSKKITDSLDKIVSNNVDKDYNEIYFFILGKKQKDYSVDFNKYDTLDCSENNIWDVKDIISWCAQYDSLKMEQVWNIIKQEIVVDEKKTGIAIEIKKGIVELKNTIHKIFETANQLIETHYESEDFIKDVKKSLYELDQMLPYIDEKTYFTCKEVLENGLKLGEDLQNYNKWEWEIKLRCTYIEGKFLLERNLKEASELIENDILGLRDGIDIVIDGDDLFERLGRLKIDEDILYKQFSVMKLQKVIEDSILRSCKSCMIIFSKNNRHYNSEVICRLQAEGTQVILHENRLETLDFMCKQIKEELELVLISSSEDMVSNAFLEKDNCYLYTVSFEKDLLTPVFFSNGDISSRELSCCFKYNEGNSINISNITEDIFRDMLANASDCTAHQLRVDCSGEVYLSTTTGAKEIDGLRFRWESWGAGTGFVGPRAASDQPYVKKTMDSIKRCWEKGIRGYCDYYNSF